MADTNLMTIPGLIDPVPLPRASVVDGVTPREDGRVDVLGLPKSRIAALFADAGLDARQSKLRAKQVYHWLYHRGVTDFADMTDIAKTMRPWLAERFVIGRPEIVEAQHSTDGTRKWLLRTPDGHDYEMVFIPDADRGTLCVSSQVGCTLNCSFCHTGTQRLVRNLTAAEIVAQVMVARDRLGDYPGRDRAVGPGLPTEGDRLVTNIVFMGMGEPLYAYDSVKEAIETLSDGDGLGLGRRRITVSTSGVVPEIERLGAEVGPMLAISLHAVRDKLRDELVPINKKYPIAELMEACRTYPAASNAKRITFEYVMLKGVNDSPADARALVKLLEGVPAKINLIPFNPWPGTQYECSDWETIERFSDIVFRAGYASPVRTPRGRDILAACGQLKSESEKLSARERLALRAMMAQDE